jgi:hypothetical protein
MRKSSFSLLLLPIFIFLIICLIEIAIIVVVHQAKFCYTLDDAYIHLSLAENISEKHYGVNPGEFSAPASSIAWPFILSLFPSSGTGQYMPLIINIIISIVIIIIMFSVILNILDSYEKSNRFFIVNMMVILLIIAGNIAGLVFTGMEHSLQLLFSLLLIRELFYEQKTKTVSFYLVLALICGPLVRYENLALSLPVLFYILKRGHVKAFLFSSVALIGLIGGFSAFLSYLGLGLFPSSVIVKSEPVALGGSVISLAGNFLRNILLNRQGMLLFGILLGLIYTSVNRRLNYSERLFAKCITAAVLLHLIIGRFDGYQRYEIYIWISSLLVILYFYRSWLVILLNWKSGIPGLALLCLFASLTCTPYIGTLFTIPQASYNIYSQHYQMHRFVSDYMPVNVAVNDLGWICYQNDNYVLDLWGLASKEALSYRRQKANPDWMVNLTKEHNVKIVMIYKEWFPSIPENWIPLGVLYLDQKRITPAFSNVTFFALDQESCNEAKSVLEDYRKTLPAGAGFAFSDD